MEDSGIVVASVPGLPVRTVRVARFNYAWAENAHAQRGRPGTEARIVEDKCDFGVH